jgi:hypothetical protein
MPKQLWSPAASVARADWQRKSRLFKMLVPVNPLAAQIEGVSSNQPCSKGGHSIRERT